MTGEVGVLTGQLDEDIENQDLGRIHSKDRKNGV